ncbi:hypothetical protein K490DRAFT_71032 [Saccharata proteae CBS 121410]|uniref:Uncharacterized protein n=1 Tax=Saccharata proteae CBS 121410 TaxID=1314787 RepID=A0A9P4LYU0_9PEZI|nr:hypothetical protein K490DRAFT_71032 [Saccharata proteae CBS 121410]
MATTSTKPALSALKTPLSATYPSELRSPMPGTPSFIKREEGEKTPITPPAAYVDFLKALSPVLMSPIPTGTSSKFSFNDRPQTSRTSSSSTASSTTSSMTSTATDVAEKPESPAASQPSSPTPSTATAPTKEVVIPPPSPFVRPMSARTPRLRIPASPFSAGLNSPMSARSLHSPYSATMSPSSWTVDGKAKEGNSTRAVSVRQVVTRTVTYSRTPVDTHPVAPLDPAPKGKRRRIS